jgi:RecB family endonuclease NucS
LDAHLPEATRLVMVKADGSVSIHADDRAYKPLNWMTAPCQITESEDGRTWTVTGANDDMLRISFSEFYSDDTYDLGEEPGLNKDGVEAQLQELLAAHPETFGEGWQLVRREYPTAIGPVDLMFRDAAGQHVAVEVKRRGEIDGVEQLTRYLELLNADPLLRPVRGVFAAQVIKPQAKVVAESRSISCQLVDYNFLRGLDNPEDRLF